MPFKMSFQISDGNTLEVLNFLAGKVSGLEILPLDNRPVQPHASRPNKGKSIKETGKRNFCEILGLDPGHSFRPRDLDAKLPGIGLSKESSGYVIRNELAGNRIRKLDNGLYEVLPWE